MSDSLAPTLALQNIDLVFVSMKKNPSAPKSQGTGSIQLKIDELEESNESFERVTHVRVTLETDSGDEIAIIETAYHVVLSTPEATNNEDSQQISELAFRLSFPFHRSTISDLLGKSGINGFMMPLISDEMWPSVIADSQAANEETAAE